MKHGLLFLLAFYSVNLFSQSNKQNITTHCDVLALVNKSFDACELNSLKANVRTRIGNIITINIPNKNTTKLNRISSITHWQKAGRVKRNLERAVSDLRADSVHLGTNLNTAYTGENVIIGVTDWGFDYTHPMFYDSALKETRILAAWDQYKKSGPTPEGYDYGTEHEGQIELLAAGSDTSNVYNYGTHGTHVAGIAGGSGGGTTHRGVAYKANFLFATFLVNEAAFIDAVAWMKNKADFYNKRLVVNMSWGLYNIGTMDGNSLISQALDAFSEEGIVFVTSGGNNGGVNFHIKKTFQKDTLNTRVGFYNYNAHPKMYGQCITMWGEENKPFSMFFSIYDINKNFLKTSPTFSTLENKKNHSGFIIHNSDTIFYKLVLDGMHPLNKRNFMRLKIKNKNSDYRIGLHSFAESGTVHYWNVVELTNDVGNWGLPFTQLFPTWTAGDNKYGVGEPASTKSVITVAAHVSEFKAPDGNTVGGQITNFSSRGPTLDERIKPDVSAPGFEILSSASSFSDGNHAIVENTTFKGKSYPFARFSGTSMSSPATAGVVALVLSANPRLTSKQVKEIIIKTTREDDKTGDIKDTGSVVWGWGKVNAYRAVLEAQNRIPNQETFLYPNPVKDIMWFYSKDNETHPITIYSNTGHLVYKGTIGRYHSIRINHLRNGLYFAQIDNGVFKLFKE